MSGTENIREKLLSQVAEERNFRQQIVADIAALLRNPMTPPILRLFIVLVLLVALGLSFVLTIFIINAILIFFLTIPFNPFWYVLVIAIKVMLLVALSIPLVLKAASTEQALRLDESFNKVYGAKFGK